MVSNRRDFLRTAVMGGIGATGLSLSRSALAQQENAPALVGTSSSAGKVCIASGENRAENIVKALKPFAQEIKAAIGNRPIVIKPNNVAIDVPLCATHVDCLDGILEFLNSQDIKNDICIAESAASGPTLEGFENYKYMALKNKYKIDFVDLDKEPFERVHVISDENFHPYFVRMSKLLLDPQSFVISAAVMKTHDRVVATLSLKNIVLGAPIKDEGFRWGRGSTPGAKNDKPVTHGGGCKGVNYNLFQLSSRLHPHLSVIDGFQGMEGNGPTGGTPVDHRVAVASLDWFAADRTAVELMGIDFANMGYLNYIAQSGRGEADISKYEQLGEKIEDHKRAYKLHDNIESQMLWKQA